MLPMLFSGTVDIGPITGNGRRRKRRGIEKDEEILSSLDDTGTEDVLQGFKRPSKKVMRALRLMFLPNVIQD